MLGCGEAGGGGDASDAKVIYKVATGEEADRPGFVKLTTSRLRRQPSISKFDGSFVDHLKSILNFER